MSSMTLRRNQSGSTALAVTVVVLALFLVGSLAFGFWAFAGRRDLKNNVDEKVAAAVTIAKQQESTRKDTEFAEISKSPLKTYNGPENYGSLRVQYPKTWSGYVATSNDSAPYVDGYFNPGVVPGVDAETSVFALRVRVNSDSFSTIMENYRSAVEDGTVKVTPYKLPLVPGIVGAKVVGEIDNDKQGTLIVVPLRANALEVWTESDKYLPDFNKYILPNLKFRP